MTRAGLAVAIVLGACSSPGLDELPSPETCQWEYDVGRVNDVALTMEIGAAGGSGFRPLGGDVELGTTHDGRWGFAIDLRIATTDAVMFPERVCSEVMGTLNFEGGLSTRGLLFRRQADGSMLARNAIMDPGVMPSTSAPFRGVVRANYPIGPSTIFGFGTYSSAASATVSVNLVNNVGFLSDNPDQSVDGGVPSDAVSPQFIRNCTGLLVSGPPYCSQFDMSPTSGPEPPANAINQYLPTYCPNDGIPSGMGPCDEPINQLNQTAVCTVPTTEPWGTMVIRQYTYGPVADPTGAQADCASRGGTYTLL